MAKVILLENEIKQLSKMSKKTLAVTLNLKRIGKGLYKPLFKK